MKCLTVLSLAIAACAASVIKTPEGYQDGDRYFYFAGDEDDFLTLVDSWEPVDDAALNDVSRNAQNNQYWLYTRSNPNTPQHLINNDISSVLNSNFDVEKPTIFTVHGWNSHGNTSINTLLRDAFLEDGDVNVIALDWNRLANRNYVTAKAGASKVGEGMGEFINWLVSLGLSYENVHLVGFSLGGHLVGSAGRATGGRVKRITGLDPAGPLWALDKKKLKKSDAQYVEIIHTNTNFLGYTDPLGDVDHYPNGGTNMPGCMTPNCSHSRAYHLMASSVRNNHLVAKKCKDIKEKNRNKCKGDEYLLGNSDLNKSGSGIFRVNTKKNYPY